MSTWIATVFIGSYLGDGRSENVVNAVGGTERLFAQVADAWDERKANDVETQVLVIDEFA
jgi:hypothetical protein